MAVWNLQLPGVVDPDPGGCVLLWVELGHGANAALASPDVGAGNGSCTRAVATCARLGGSVVLRLALGHGTNSVSPDAGAGDGDGSSTRPVFQGRLLPRCRAHVAGEAGSWWACSSTCSCGHAPRRSQSPICDRCPTDALYLACKVRTCRVRVSFHHRTRPNLVGSKSAI